MKKILVALILLTVLAGAAFAAGASDSAKGVEITLMQGKPEIDAMLKVYAAIWGEKTGNTVVIKSIGGSSSISMNEQMKADFAAGDMPDIFAIAGVENYKDWETLILDQSDAAWTKETAVAYSYNGKTYGFPVAVEGWGMAYNADMLKKAGIDPASLVNYAGYKAAFEKLDTMKASLGIDSVVSMAAAMDMSWVTAHHNFNSLLSNGLKYGDLSVVDDLLAGKVDAKRLSEYADWVELLFMYADKAVLTTGDYAAQVGAFATGNAVFLHQGNWTDPNMAEANATFEMAFAPHGSMHSATDGIFVAAPSFYAINKDSKNVEVAKQFLNDLVFTSEGQNYMVNEAGMIPAYGNVKLNPKGQLSKSVQKWAGEGKVYSWNQENFTLDLRNNILAPIYNQFAIGAIDKAKFVQLLTAAFEGLK